MRETGTDNCMWIWTLARDVNFQALTCRKIYISSQDKRRGMVAEERAYMHSYRLKLVATLEIEKLSFSTNVGLIRCFGEIKTNIA